MARLGARGICKGIRAFLVQITRLSSSKAAVFSHYKKLLPRMASWASWGVGWVLPAPWPTAGQREPQQGGHSFSWHSGKWQPTRTPTICQPCCHLPSQCPGFCRLMACAGPWLCELHEPCQPREKPFLRGSSCPGPCWCIDGLASGFDSMSLKKSRSSEFPAGPCLTPKRQEVPQGATSRRGLAQSFDVTWMQ